MKDKHIFAEYYKSLTDQQKQEFIELLQKNAAQKCVDSIRQESNEMMDNIDEELGLLFHETQDELREMRESLEDLSELVSEAKTIHEIILYDQYIGELNKLKNEQDREMLKQEIHKTVQEYQHIYNSKKRIYFQ